MLDQIIKPAEYAEDQQYARLVLGTHVIHRGFNMGSIIGIAASLAMKAPKMAWSLSHTLRFAANGGLFGLGFGALALTGRMYGKGEIEWQDRSWRLLQHPTQNQSDHFSEAGAVLGVLVQAARGSAGLASGRAVFGAAAMGSSAGIVAMLVYRAATGGFNEEKKAEVEPKVAAYPS